MIKFAIDENTYEFASSGNRIELELALLAYGICENDRSLDLFINLIEHVQSIMQEREKEKHDQI